MKQFKLNSNAKVLLNNQDVIFPKVTQQESHANLRTFALREEDNVKLEKLRAKYKVSRSAVIRILLSQVEV